MVAHIRIPDTYYIKLNVMSNVPNSVNPIMYCKLCLKGMLDGVCLRISIVFFTKSTIEVLIRVELKLIQFEYFVE